MSNSKVRHKVLRAGVQSLKAAVNWKGLWLALILCMTIVRLPRFRLFFQIGSGWTMVRGDQPMTWVKA